MKDVSPKTDRRATLLRIAGTLIALALLIYLLSLQGWQEILLAIRQIPISSILLALALMMLSRLAVTTRWHVLLRSGGIKIPFTQTLRITFAGLFASNFLPTTIGGDVIRLAGAIRLGYDTAVSTASLITDRLVGMAGMAMTALLGLPIVLKNSSLLFGAGSVILTRQKPGTWWNTMWEKTRDLVHKVFVTMGLWLKQPKSLLHAMLYTFLHMACFFGIIYLLYAGLGQTIPFWVIAGLYSIVYFVTLIPISINGYGLQELSMTFIFTKLAGVSIANALIVALIFRTLTMLTSLPGAVFVPGIMAGDRADASPASGVDMSDMQHGQ
jgi:uncharacterized membrane protein YbhN (UPF0104 family)